MKEAEIQFLKKVDNSTGPSCMKWDWSSKVDKGTVDANLCFAWSCLPNISDPSQTKSVMTFASEAKVMKKFSDICKDGFSK